MSDPCWHAIGASVHGVSHARTETPCQDYFATRVLSADALVVGVADGAGSVALAREGANLVVEGALRAVAALWSRYRPASRKAWRELMTTAFTVAQKVVALHASKTGAQPADYAATLALVIVTPELVVCGLIGDCAVVIATDDGQLHSLCKPQRGAYANSTYFATHHRLAARLDIQLWEQPVRHVALLSDGLLSLAMNIERNQPHAPFFTPLFAFAASAAQDAAADGRAVQDLTALLDSERVNQRTHDDKTLVLLTRQPPVGAAIAE